MSDTAPQTAEVGVIGMAVMGSNLARNMAHKGFRVAVYNRTASRTDEVMAEHGDEGTFLPFHDLAGFVASLERPRRIVMMVKAGRGTDAVIKEITPLLQPGDVLVDGGNAYFGDTRRREEEIRPTGIHYVGTGISGGEVGALEGPSIMPGGSPESYEAIGPVLEKISAQVDGEPCCAWMGTDGAGHFVKMVHNGIEYADMQFIGEAHALLRAAGLTNAEAGDVFESWNHGDLDSYLVEITSRVLRAKDPRDPATDLLDAIRDEAGMKGTGTWTVQTALELGVDVSTISEAVFARSVSSALPLRTVGQQTLEGTAPSRSMTVRPSSTTFVTLCGLQRSSPTPKGSTRSAPRRSSTTGRSTWARSPPSGAMAASSEPASFSASRTSTRPETSPPFWRHLPSRPSSLAASRHGVASSPERSRPECQFRDSPQPWAITTRFARHVSTPPSPRACATSSAPTPTAVSTTRVPGMSTGPAMDERSVQTDPLTAPRRRPSSVTAAGPPRP